MESGSKIASHDTIVDSVNERGNNILKLFKPSYKRVDILLLLLSWVESPNLTPKLLKYDVS